MTRKSIGSWSGLGLFVAAACAGGGGPNDFGAPENDVPLDPGAPSDPNAPPASTTEPPFGGVAPPPPSSQPPTSGGGTGNGGTDGGGNCSALCNETAQACQVGSDPAAIAECVAGCDDIPTRCFSRLQSFYRCGIENDCSLENDACEERRQNLVECVGAPDTDGP